MRKTFSFIFFSLFLVILAACGNDEKSQETKQTESQEKVEVVTTYSILYDIVKNVGGDQVEVHSIAPIGADPHEYEPLPQDVQKATDADIIFYNGLNLETGNGWFEKLLSTTGKDGKDAPVFEMSKGVEVKYLTSEGNKGEEDPHAWLDVRNGIKYAENARDALIEIDPDHAERYEENAEAYIEELEQLHEKAVEKFNQIPEEERFLVTSEGAFKYFSDAYDFEAGYIWEINAENEGSPDQIRSIVDLIQEKDVKALFVETSIDPRSMEQVSRETDVPIAGEIFTDSLDEPGEDGDTYIKMMEWNMDMIYDSLTE
ncbi:metal ABC transporter substrate-binding protein [Alteribacillus bidgolensis]|uniref:Iron/zinc/copper transport system substrate-binding protein n=1 Tax=Alteribacillus bidgolensis TaxID=930129 RepID=A0A1G8IMA3_9BACI|nr:metal ABC transporter substrate-binding protein [Alteribacillus bidgolensis]SDI20035.1 iron/zinc/copper transport system substrate-binding protein [Alteribacillus bidgolensis]